MRLAFITDELPRAGVAGHLAFNAAVTHWLRAQGHEVVVVLVRPRLRWPVERFINGAVVGPGVVYWDGRVICWGPRHIAAILAKRALASLPTWLGEMLRTRGRGPRYGIVDAILGAFLTPVQVRWCADKLTALQPDAVLVDTIFRSPVLDDPQICRMRRVIFTHDLFHQRHRILASAGYRLHPAELSREMEAVYLNKADVISAIQPAEAAEIRTMCPNRQVIVNPMPAIPCPRPAHVQRRSERLVFIGGDTLPNRDGLLWFFEEIWPRLRSWRATVTLDLVGDCIQSLRSVPTGVHRVGRVPDLARILHEARLAISPLRVGSGLKLKILDYARHGLRTVATPMSLEGFADDPQAPFITASDSLAFSEAIQRYLAALVSITDEAEALRYVERHYGIDKSFGSLTAYLAAPIRQTV
ncbi:MAG: hypothetical protein B7Z75_03195 [Acidocella sp. 20-57-95]|nr:MAG: hypothetical protein B7Z75_03195 [Acidocella sp. 20-57-95]HQT64752.1 glycosyltransferase family 4 protein [Acidocella sp.]